MARSIHQYFTRHVSKTVLLTTLLPLSFASLFGTLLAAALIFPGGYDWRVRVISTLTSPRDNPQGCWLPSIGIMAAMLVAFAFLAGSVLLLPGSSGERRKRSGLAAAPAVTSLDSPWRGPRKAFGVVRQNNPAKNPAADQPLLNS
jgi:hypothetical protein